MPYNTRPSSGSEGNPSGDYEDVVELFRSSYGDSPRDVKANEKLNGPHKKGAQSQHPASAYSHPHNINYDGGNHGSSYDSTSDSDPSMNAGRTNVSNKSTGGISNDGNDARSKHGVTYRPNQHSKRPPPRSS